MSIVLKYYMLTTYSFGFKFFFFFLIPGAKKSGDFRITGCTYSDALVHTYMRKMTAALQMKQASIVEGKLSNTSSSQLPCCKYNTNCLLDGLWVTHEKVPACCIRFSQFLLPYSQFQLLQKTARNNNSTLADFSSHMHSQDLHTKQ